MKSSTELGQELLAQFSSSLTIQILVACFVIYIFFPDYNRSHILPGLPIAGSKWRFEPRFITRYRAVSGHFDIVTEAVKRYNDEPFTVLRPDSSITYIPRRFVPELERMKETVLSPKLGQVSELVPKWTETYILLNTNITFKALMLNVNQHLDRFVPSIEEETNYALDVEMPECDGHWTDFDPRQILVKIMSRNATKLMAGPSLCRNEEFLEINSKLAENMFGTIISLRMLPSFLHPIVGPLLPMPHRFSKMIDAMEKHMGPMIEERRKAEADGSYQNGDKKKPEDVTQWHMDYGTGSQLETRDLVLRYAFTSLASVGAVVSTLSKAFYELCDDPQLLEPLRKEVEDVLAQDGGKWTKNTIDQLVKMDSFLKECLRTNVQSCVPFRRVVVEPAGVTLSSGLHLPAGLIFAIPTSDPSFDPIPDSDSFLPFRWVPSNANGTSQELLSTPSLASHQFGLGRYPCSGRFIASMEMKMLLSKLIRGWDWGWKDGSGRPPHMQLFEMQFWDPDATKGGVLKVRKRGSDGEDL